MSGNSPLPLSISLPVGVRLPELSLSLAGAQSPVIFLSLSACCLYCLSIHLDDIYTASVVCVFTLRGGGGGADLTGGMEEIWRKQAAIEGSRFCAAC